MLKIVSAFSTYLFYIKYTPSDILNNCTGVCVKLFTINASAENFVITVVTTVLFVQLLRSWLWDVCKD